MNKDILKKDYRHKEFELMNEDYKCYEFTHWKGNSCVLIKCRDCSKNAFGVSKGKVVVSVATANKFFKKLIGDGYKWNTSYVY